MPDFASRGMQVDLKCVFVSPVTYAPFDPVNPTVEIVHYVGITEITDLPETSLTRIKEGHYIYNWTVPSLYPEDETAFVYFRGTNQDLSRQTLQSTVRIVSPDFFNGGSGSSGLIIKFTKD